MSYSFYVSQLENLCFLNDVLKKSLESLKFVNVNCPETSLVLNKIEEELKENEQSIDEFNNFLLIDITDLLKVYENNEQYIIKEMFEKIDHALLTSAYKIIDLENKTKRDMPCSFYVSQLKNLHFLNDTLKKSLGSLKFANANCTETSLMLNKIEEELNEIEQRMAVFDNFVLNGTGKVFKVYQDNEQSLIKEMYEKIHHDLLTSAYKINDLEKEQTFDIDDLENETEQDMSYSFYVSQLKNLYLLNDTSKKSLGLLKILNANCPEKSLVLNKIEEELNKIEQRMDAFDILLLKDDEELSELCQNDEHGIIKEILYNIHYALSASAYKINDLEKEHTIEDIVQNKTKQDMPYSFYVSQLEDLHLLYGAFKNSLGPLKFLNVNCLEKSLVLNKIEEELNGIGRSIDALDTLLLKDNTELLKVYKNNEQGIIKKMYEKIRHDLSVLVHEIADLVN